MMYDLAKNDELTQINMLRDENEIVGIKTKSESDLDSQFYEN